jgi:hypothetical protein
MRQLFSGVVISPEGLFLIQGVFFVVSMSTAAITEILLHRALVSAGNLKIPTLRIRFLT